MFAQASRFAHHKLASKPTKLTNKLLTQLARTPWQEKFCKQVRCIAEFQEHTADKVMTLTEVKSLLLLLTDIIMFNCRLLLLLLQCLSSSIFWGRGHLTYLA